MPLLRLSAGLTLWAIGFCAIYAVHGLGCALGWPNETVGPFELHRASMIALWACFTLAGIWLALVLGRYRGSAMDRASMLLAWAGAGTTLVSGLPIVLVPACL
ncbi:hypothetical protein [Fulvimarina endophytica]|nr:hypothetical protein [Fulvimarina endophytica]